jgi:hypothetical protein
MSPLSNVVNTPSANNNTRQHLCSGCRKQRETWEFPLKSRGEGKGVERASTCTLCVEARKGSRERRQEATEDLPIIELGHLLPAVKDYLSTSNTDSLLEARVGYNNATIPEFKNKHGKIKTRDACVAQMLANAINDNCNYRFM